MLRPNVLRFVLTPFTAKERCRLVQNQLGQLQYEHSQLLSHTGRQTESNNTLPAERAKESTQVCKPGPEGIDKEEQPETGYKSKTAQKRYKEMESDLDNLLRDLEREAAKIRYKEMESNLDNLMRDLERELTSMNSKVEKENLQLKAEQHIHSKTTFQIQSHCDMNKSSFETGRELRENVAEVKNLVKRVQEENDLSAGYTSRKKAKLVGSRFKLYCVKCTSTLFNFPQIGFCTVSEKLLAFFDPSNNNPRTNIPLHNS